MPITNKLLKNVPFSKELVLFLLCLAFFSIIAVSLIFGSCQTTKYHYIFQHYYLMPCFPSIFFNREVSIYTGDFKIYDNYTGVWAAYFKNGNKKFKANVLAGKLFGEVVSWHVNGQICHQFYATKEGINGPYKIFNSDGKKIFIGNYLKDQLHGVQKHYYSNGKIRLYEVYENGKKIDSSLYSDCGLEIKNEQNHSTVPFSISFF